MLKRKQFKMIYHQISILTESVKNKIVSFRKQQNINNQMLKELCYLVTFSL